MKRIYKMPFAWLLGLLLCGSLGFQANAQQLDNLLAMNVEDAYLDSDKVSENEVEDSDSFGCIGGRYFRVNGGAWQCTRRGVGAYWLSVRRSNVGGQASYRVYKYDSAGNMVFVGDYDTLPLLEYKDLDGTISTSNFPKKFFDAQDSGGDEGPWFCDEYDSSSSTDPTKPVYLCKRCTFIQDRLRTRLGPVGGAVTALGAALSGIGKIIMSGAGMVAGGVGIGTGGANLNSQLDNFDCSRIEIGRYTKMNTGVVIPNMVMTRINPNPVSNNTTLELHLPQDDDVTVEIFNLQGQYIQTIMVGKAYQAGIQKIQLPLSGLTTGQYLVKITSSAGINLTSRVLKQ